MRCEDADGDEGHVFCYIRSPEHAHDGGETGGWLPRNSMWCVWYFTFYGHSCALACVVAQGRIISGYGQGLSFTRRWTAFRRVVTLISKILLLLNVQPSPDAP